MNLSPLLRLRVHYFAVYAIFGCLSPYLPVYLRDVKGFAPGELGTTLAFAQAGVLFMPALMTLLADRYGVVRPLLLGLFLMEAWAMVLLAQASGFVPVLLCVCLAYFAFQPKIALSDGSFFAWQSDPAQPRVAYASVRVWGTIGFVGGSVLVFGAFRLDASLAVPVSAALVAVLGAANARWLPRRPRPVAPAGARLPSLEAAELFRRPRIALFCLGVGLIVSTNSAYYGFYPLYLTEQVGLGARWVGLVANLGVAIEVGYLLSFEWLRRRCGLGGVVLLGAAACVLRQAILGWVPLAGAAVALQATHGLTVIGVLVAPVMYLNSFGRDGIRHSVQGLYAMLVAGAFGILGHLAAGQLAAHGLLHLYRVGFVVSLAGLAIAALAVRRPGVHPSAGQA